MNFGTRSRPKRPSSYLVPGNNKWRTGRRFSRREADLEESDEEAESDNEVKDWTQELMERQKLSSIKSDQDVEVQLTRKQTLILSTLVPDEILLMEKLVKLSNYNR